MTKRTDRASVSANFNLMPIPHGIRRHMLTRRAGVAAASLLSGTVAFGQGTAQIEEIIVTAQKREQSLQDVPISITVLDNQTLTDLNISRFDDYVLYLPNVSYQSAGPSQAQIYMRGVSDGNPTSGNFSGTFPTVALYLDEQPVTTIGRNLDVHIYDIDRIETLAGPQGTLYGASSQAGTIRILTNKPNTEEFQAGYDLGVNSTKDGDPGYSVEGFVNFPFADRAAIRLVGWYVEEGGWIDNVPGSVTFTQISNITANNTGNADPNLNQVEDDVNTLTTSGLRAMLGVDLSDKWALEASINFQEQESDGVFSDQPSTVGQGNVVRFFNDDHNDEWTQFGLTITGDLGWGNLTLAGSYLDRDVQYDIDYSSYSDYSAFVELYYTCYDATNYVALPCVDPRIQYNQDSNYKRSTFEARLASQGDGRFNWVAGLFYNTNEHEYFNQWHIPTIDASTGRGSALPTDRNIQGVTDLYFATNQEREITETALFGELTYDFTDKLSGTVGARFFETEDELIGFVGTIFNCFDPATGNRLGAATSTGACGAGLTTDDNDNTWKLSLEYRFTDNIMGYVTYSEGFRPSGINRAPAPTIPQIFDPDVITNYELGWKTTLADGRLRFNGAVYYMEWDDMQLTRFDPDFSSFIGLTSNTDGADITGIEADLQWLITENWSLDVAASYNEAELSGDYTVTVGAPVPDAPDGTELSFTPDLKYTIGTRYTFNQSRFAPYIQATYIYTDESWNDLFVAARVLQDDYGILNAAVGIQGDSWVAELYGDNLTDENAEILRYTRAGDNRTTANRPINFGLRFRQRF